MMNSKGEENLFISSPETSQLKAQFMINPKDVKNETTDSFLSSALFSQLQDIKLSGCVSSINRLSKHLQNRYNKLHKNVMAYERENTRIKEFIKAICILKCSIVKDPTAFPSFSLSTRPNCHQLNLKVFQQVAQENNFEEVFVETTETDIVGLMGMLEQLMDKLNVLKAENKKLKPHEEKALKFLQVYEREELQFEKND